MVKGKENKGGKFRDYFQSGEKVIDADARSHRALTILRGENEGVLSLDISPPMDRVSVDAKAIVGVHRLAVI